jgi:hypothetical protein
VKFGQGKHFIGSILQIFNCAQQISVEKQMSTEKVLYIYPLYLVKKNVAHKESSQEKSHDHRAMVGLNSQAGQGKMAQPRLWVRRGFYRKGRVRKLAHAW